ncbi:unnamed protein product [Cuscuta campestris]|uniref:Uncharacterized protein n=1 Tax=Cuscuta campestris TaxID=132261 RepID=A0A484LC26_9ASTE|nr:unnamed protein product [Cuscuta campestris]
MSSTLLEVTRASHEEIERLERVIVKDLQTEPATNKDRLYQSHPVRNVIERIIDTTHRLVDIYEDKDGVRKDEIAALGGQTATGSNMYSAFYDRLKEVNKRVTCYWRLSRQGVQAFVRLYSRVKVEWEGEGMECLGY